MNPRSVHYCRRETRPPATIYQFEVCALLQVAKRNPARFPGGFLFQLARLRSQIVISKPRRDGRRYAPSAGELTIDGTPRVAEHSAHVRPNRSAWPAFGRASDSLPPSLAYGALESMLVNAKPAGVVRRDGLTVHLFVRGSGAVAVAWIARARALSVPPSVSVFDLMGGEMPSPKLSIGEPVYVLAPKLKPAQIQELLQ